MATYHTRLLLFSQHFNKYFSHRFASLLNRTSLSMREVHVLLFLANNPEYDTARDITILRGLSKSQVSQAVDLLAAEGLVERTPDRTDRRVVHLSLTTEALPLTKECQAIQEDCSRRLLEGMTAEQADQLCSLLEIVLENGARMAEESLA